MAVNQIEKFLKDNGITKKFASEKIGMSQEGFGKAIKSGNLKTRDLFKLAEVLNVSVCELLGIEVYIDEGSGSGSGSGYYIGKGSGNIQNSKININASKLEIEILREQKKNLEEVLKNKDTIINNLNREIKNLTEMIELLKKIK